MNYVKFIQVNNPRELSVLRNKKANCKDLNFSFNTNYIQKLSNHLKSKNAIQIIAKINDKFAGYIASAEILEQYPNYLVIFELFVDPVSQGCGLGTKLVQKIINQAKNKNMKGVIVQTEKENIPAQKLYEKIGFTKIENSDWEEGITYTYE